MLVEIRLDGSTVYKLTDLPRELQVPMMRTLQAIMDIMKKEPEKYGDKNNEWMGGYDWIRFVAVDKNMCVIPLNTDSDY